MKAADSAGPDRCYRRPAGSNRAAVVLLSNSMHYWCLVTGPWAPIARLGRCAIVRRYRRHGRRRDAPKTPHIRYHPSPSIHAPIQPSILPSYPSLSLFTHRYQNKEYQKKLMHISDLETVLPDGSNGIFLTAADALHQSHQTQSEIIVMLYTMLYTIQSLSCCIQ